MSAAKSLRGIGVIFDMDGVLVDSYDAHFESWRMLAAELNAPITEARFAATFGRTSREIIDELFGIADEAGVRHCDDRKESLYRDIIRSRVPEMPGARHVIALLRAAGASIAVGSSGPPENVELVCRAMELDQHLSAVVTGRDVTRGKPDPQVFLLAAERVGIEPARCVVIEDAPAGVEAARRAGMRCIALDGPRAAPEIRRADRVVAALAELPEVVASLISAVE